MNPLILAALGLAGLALLNERGKKADAVTDDGTKPAGDGGADAPVTPGTSTETTTADGKPTTVTTVDGTAKLDVEPPAGEARGEATSTRGVMTAPGPASSGNAAGLAFRQATAVNVGTATAVAPAKISATEVATRAGVPSLSGIVSALGTLTRRDQSRMLQEYGPAAGAIW